jgi:hypothetical protein
MNRDEIWQQLKDEKETVYGEKMLGVFLTTYENRDLQAHIKNTPLGKHFAEKIIQYGKDMNLTFVDAETMAGSFYKDR